MDKNKDPMEQIIIEDLLSEAEAIDKEIEEAGVEAMPADLKEKIRGRLHEQIAEAERERAYAKLSEEDKRALELGREMLRKSESGKSEGKIVRCRKRKKVYAAVAAVAVLVLAMGITSVGGAKRVVEMIGIMVGNREVVQVNTDEDNYIVKSNKEEVAYQEIKDTFGVEPVKIVHQPKGMIFLNAEIDAELQMATFVYEYKNEIISYHISSHFTDSSWGIDVEDHITDSYYIKFEDVEVEVREYEKPETKVNRYSASYTYNGLEYFLIGVVEKEDFDFLIKNLKFF